jgi:hypothetical protein
MITNRITSDTDQLGSNNPTRQQIIAYKCRLLSQLAEVLAPAQESVAGRKAFQLFADELFDMSVEITNLEPEESDLRQVLARFGT